jgi:hypothetical protein
MELQLAWMVERWGLGVLGPEPPFALVCRMEQALDVHRAFAKDQDKRTEQDWETIKSVLRVVEEWQ